MSACCTKNRQLIAPRGCYIKIIIIESFYFSRLARGLSLCHLRPQVIFDQALLADGGQLDDPAAYLKRVNELLMR